MSKDDEKICSNSENLNEEQSPNKSVATCMNNWVDEKLNPNSDYFVCDTVCEDLEDCSDCGTGSMCQFLGEFFSRGDIVDKDLKISIIECNIILYHISDFIASSWNKYDTSWISMSNEDKCADVDLNNDAYLHPDETTRLFQHFMNYSSTNQKWEYENRYKQVTCKQCEWYEIYNF